MKALLRCAQISAGLSEDELIELNRRIVKRFQLLRSARSLAQLARFSAGMLVEFDTDDGRTVRDDRASESANCDVVTALGRWRNQFSLLRSVKTSHTECAASARRCPATSPGLAQEQKLSEAVPGCWFLGGDVAGNLVLVEQVPDGSQELRKLSSKCWMVPGGIGK